MVGFLYNVWALGAEVCLVSVWWVGLDMFDETCECAEGIYDDHSLVY